MAQVTIEIPSQHASRVVHALCRAHGLEENAANAKAALIDYIKRTVRNVERSEAEEAARAAIVEPDVEGVAE